MHHSCGNIIEIIQDLIEIGLDVLTPIQPDTMLQEFLSKQFGEKLSFLGGISTQKTLLFGMQLQVKNEIIERGKMGAILVQVFLWHFLNGNFGVKFLSFFKFWGA